MPAPGRDYFEPDLDTGDFDPIERREIDEALAETPEGNKKFKEVLLTEVVKRRKFCKKATGNFHGRISVVERKVFAWKYQLGGILLACGILLPVVAFFLVKYVFK